MGIDLDIEELVLHGFAAQDRDRLAEAVRLELINLLRSEGAGSLAAQPRALDRLEAESITITPGRQPQSAGRQIARSIYRSLHPGCPAAPNPPSGRGVRRP